MFDESNDVEPQQSEDEDFPTKEDAEGARPGDVGKVPGEGSLPDVQDPTEDKGTGSDPDGSEATGDGPSGGGDAGGGVVPNPPNQVSSAPTAPPASPPPSDGTEQSG